MVKPPWRPGRGRSARDAVVAALAGALLAGLAPGAPAGAQERRGGGGAGEAAPPDSTAVLRGRIAIAGTGEPLVSAVVEVVGRTRRAVADSSGAYRIAGLRPGTVQVRASYLGARTDEKTVELEAGETARVDFEASQLAVEMRELRVDVERRRRGKMAGFEERRDRGLGDFVTREEIERINPIRTTQIIRREALGERVVYDPETGEFRLLLRGGGIGRCPPAVFLDGGLMPDFRVNDIAPEDIQAIEVYQGAETPVQYDVVDGCGAVLIWTRSGGD